MRDEESLQKEFDSGPFDRCRTPTPRPLATGA